VFQHGEWTSLKAFSGCYLVGRYEGRHPHSPCIGQVYTTTMLQEKAWLQRCFNGLAIGIQRSIMRWLYVTSMWWAGLPGRVDEITSTSKLSSKYPVSSLLLITHVTVSFTWSISYGRIISFHGTTSSWHQHRDISVYEAPP